MCQNWNICKVDKEAHVFQLNIDHSNFKSLRKADMGHEYLPFHPDYFTKRQERKKEKGERREEEKEEEWLVRQTDRDQLTKAQTEHQPNWSQWLSQEERVSAEDTDPYLLTYSFKGKKKVWMYSLPSVPYGWKAEMWGPYPFSTQYCVTERINYLHSQSLIGLQHNFSLCQPTLWGSGPVLWLGVAFPSVSKQKEAIRQINYRKMTTTHFINSNFILQGIYHY